MRVEMNVYPGGTDRVLTMSYDDGREFDRKLVEIFNTYGIRGTFHLNSGKLDAPGYITAAEVKDLYKGHEVSSHMLTHPFPNYLSNVAVLEESIEDRKNLEALCGYVVRGMSYPFGNYDARTVELFRSAGMEYSRTTKSTHVFDFPEEPLTWHPTCHHREDCVARLEQFLEPSKYENGKLLYVWGHSYEFDTNQNWELIEEFCKRAAGQKNVWYATNIEIVDYRNAQKQIRFSADGKLAYNPTATDVWVRVDKEPVCLPAGKTTTL